MNSSNIDEITDKKCSASEAISKLKEIISGFLFRLFYAFRLVWEAKPSLLIILLGMSALNGITPVIGSLIGANLLNKLALAYSGDILIFSVIVILILWQYGFYSLNVVISRIIGTIVSNSGDLVSYFIRVKLLDKAKTIDLARYDQPAFYARLENAAREAGTRPVQMISATFSIVSSIISIVSFVAILLAVYPFAPLVMVVTSIPTAVISYRFRKKNVNYMVEHSKERRKMEYYSGLLTNKDMVKEVRIYHLEPTFTQKYQTVFEKYYCGIKALRWKECIWSFLAYIPTLLLSGAFSVWFAYGVYLRHFPIGNFSLYSGAVSSISSGVSSLIATTASIYEGTLFIDNLIAFFQEKPRIVCQMSPAVPVQKGGHTIEFDHVSFYYPGKEKEVLTNISFKIYAGETLFLVGVNGAGKTTLLKLMTRLYDPSEGRILLDGQDIRNYEVQDLYSIFGIIFQDFGKYAVTARENISFGDVMHAKGEDEIHAAAVKSTADSFITAFPDGYDTPMMRFFEENGIEPSTGQWQKLALSRAFYRDSDILILDEPTASLDPLAEEEIFRQLERSRDGKITVFVSHRLSCATLADRIIVLKDGQIVEQGTHSELLHLGGVYADLYQTQASKYQ